MRLARSVEDKKIASVIRHQNSTRFVGKTQNVLVENRLIRITRFVRGEHVVAQRAQVLNNRQRNVFVGIEPSQSTRLRVRSRLVHDLVAVRREVRPCCAQVRGGQPRVDPEKLVVAQALALVLNK